VATPPPGNKGKRVRIKGILKNPSQKTKKDTAPPIEPNKAQDNIPTKPPPGNPQRTHNKRRRKKKAQPAKSKGLADK
jgi:hypothetical protein